MNVSLFKSPETQKKFGRFRSKFDTESTHALDKTEEPYSDSRSMSLNIKFGHRGSSSNKSDGNAS